MSATLRVERKNKWHVTQSKTKTKRKDNLKFKKKFLRLKTNE